MTTQTDPQRTNETTVFTFHIEELLLDSGELDIAIEDAMKKAGKPFGVCSQTDGNKVWNEYVDVVVDWDHAQMNRDTIVVPISYVIESSATDELEEGTCPHCKKDY